MAADETDASPGPRRRWAPLLAAGRSWRLPLMPRGLRALREDPTVRLMLVAALIGAVAGLAAGALDRGIVAVNHLLLGTAEPSLGGVSPLRALLGPVVGGLLAGLAVRFGTRGRRSYEVPDVIEATANRGGRLSLRDGLATGLAAVAVVGGGQSGGREGPTVQLCGALSSHVCRRFDIPAGRARVLVAAGAAAGLAASFNTPFGAAFFALEIIVGNFAMEMFAPVVAATVAGTVVGRVVLHKDVALSLPPFGLHSPVELAFYMVLGALCGAVAVAFKRLRFAIDRRAGELGLTDALRPVAAGAAVGLLGVAGMNEVMGNGYGWMQAAVRGELGVGLGLLFLVGVVKLVATALTSAGRGGAGVFAPSLFLGAAFGTAFGTMVHGLWPGVTESPGAYGIVGMGAVVAAVTHAPITMALMLFEMTHNYAIILPLLLALATAGIVDAAFGSESFYLLLLQERGVTLEHRREELVMYELRVRDLLRRDDVVRIRRSAPFEELAELFLHHRVDDVFVVDDQGRLDGVVDIQDVKELLLHPREGVRVADVETRSVPVLRPEMPLADALGRFFHADLEELPVVDRAGRLVGVLRERDLIAAYHREVLRRDALLARIESGPPGRRRVDYFELPPGHVMRSVRISGQLVGRTLRELRLPARYRCTVLAVVTHDPETGRPRRLRAEAGLRLSQGDRLIVVGPETDVDLLCTEAADAEETEEIARGAPLGGEE